MRYNVDCHASRLCGRLQTAHTLQNVPDYYIIIRKKSFT